MLILPSQPSSYALKRSGAALSLRSTACIAPLFRPRPSSVSTMNSARVADCASPK